MNRIILVFGGALILSLVSGVLTAPTKDWIGVYQCKDNKPRLEFPAFWIIDHQSECVTRTTITQSFNDDGLTLEVYPPSQGRFRCSRDLKLLGSASIGSSEIKFRAGPRKRDGSGKKTQSNTPSQTKTVKWTTCVDVDNQGKMESLMFQKISQDDRPNFKKYVSSLIRVSFPVDFVLKRHSLRNRLIEHSNCSSS